MQQFTIPKIYLKEIKRTYTSTRQQNSTNPISDGNKISRRQKLIYKQETMAGKTNYYTNKKQ